MAYINHTYDFRPAIEGEFAEALRHLYLMAQSHANTKACPRYLKLAVQRALGEECAQMNKALNEVR